MDFENKQDEPGWLSEETLSNQSKSQPASSSQTPNFTTVNPTDKYVANWQFKTTWKF
jgi:hypothetical protein